MASGISPSELRRFIAHSEGTISPKAVSGLYGRAEMLARLPQSLQRWVVARAGSSADEYMGFIVEPYAFFLAYEITDTDAAERMLPDGYRLVPTAMFADEAPRSCAILGAFNVRASVFQGARVELYVIAESIRTGMLTWVICDVESNTINYDPGEGFQAASTERAIVTTAHTGDVIVDVQSAERANTLTATASVPAGTMHPLDQRLWVEGNLSVDYGGRLAHDGSEPFGLVFDPAEMAQALRIPLDAVAVEANTFGAGWRADAPFEAACFPYAQHFLTTNYPRSTPIRDEAAVSAAVRAQVAGTV
ncbi:hypothetical protein [Agromyces sp. SYSU T00194]|uniref:hypothetical protein n=1 Tax=Agromyces chitinivorans TaxID=3158560 RepID=UPI00339B2BC8